MGSMYDVMDCDLIYQGDDDQDIEYGNKKEISADEACVLCKNRYGRVNLDFMSEVSGLSKESLILSLRGNAIFQNPEVFTEKTEWNIDEGWMFAEQYLYGNIFEKLKIATEINRRFLNCFSDNIAALKRILPEKIDMDNIHVSLGASWIPSGVYACFIKELLKLKEKPEVFYIDELCEWKIEELTECKKSVLNNLVYGTVEMSAIKIIEKTMNAQVVKVYDTLYRGASMYPERILNEEATLMVREKQKMIEEAFKEWVMEKSDLKRKLEEIYNETYTSYAHSPYDGSFLTLPGLNPKVTLYSHQKNAIARIVLANTNVLLAHDVGSGKTYEMIVGVHELKRMGLSGKNLIVVPNNVLQSTVESHHYLYPEDKILVVYPKDFSPQYRNDVLKKIRDSDYVAVYMAYSSFDMITMSKGYRIKKLENEILKLKKSMDNTSRKKEKRLLEAEIRSLEKKLKKYVEDAEESTWLSYDQLGITTLVVDEAHNFKNIPLQSKTENVVGMHVKGSKKCEEMLLKCHATKRVIFATGTPLTNSIADAYVLQHYLMPNALEFYKINSFDAWINTFGEKEQQYEMDVDCSNLRVMTRFNKFHNLSEMMAMLSLNCDFYHTDENNMDLPKVFYKDICIPKSEVQDVYIKELAERTELIRKKQVSPMEDNILKVITDGRKCALDIRLVDENLVWEKEYSKIASCAKKVAEIYFQTKNTCQLVFSDIGTPKNGFNVYDALRDELVKLGVKREEIAYVHDAVTDVDRNKLFKAMNQGKIRVAIGSTQKLGVGVNVQENLVALHHLSIPWRPADMVQREGRIVRQGNSCREVSIYRYITEGTFDAYSYQLLENKQRFISSFLSGTMNRRDVEDISDSILSYAEIKALAIGDSLIKERVETENQLLRTKVACNQRKKQMTEILEIVERTPKILEECKRELFTVKRDRFMYKKCKTSVSEQERNAFGEELLEAIYANKMYAKERVFDTYQGFAIVLPANMFLEKPYVWVRSNNGGSYQVIIDGEKAYGCSQRIDHVLNHLEDRMDRLKEKMKKTKIQSMDAKKELQKGNVYETELKRLAEKLKDIDKKLEERGKNGK